MKTIIHRNESRGHANHGWLDSYHSFSFAAYHNPERVHFGLLRVLNDDTVAGAKGFGTHPHDNMEIISIPLKGSLEHRDSMNTIGVIGPNDVQAMSAGTGIMHSEYNHSSSEEVKFLQIWIFPKVRNIKPRYDQKTFDPALRQNAVQRLVSPIEDGSDTVKINQDAYISRASLDAGEALEYRLNKAGNGLYLLVLEGAIAFEDSKLNRRDAAGIVDFKTLKLQAASQADVLFIEVPMNQS